MYNQTNKARPPRVNSYRAYLQSEHWKRLRAMAFRIYGGVCEVCSTSRPINVHHLIYRRTFYDTRVSDLMVLCRHCDGTGYVRGISGWSYCAGCK